MVPAEPPPPWSSWERTRPLDPGEVGSDREPTTGSHPGSETGCLEGRREGRGGVNPPVGREPGPKGGMERGRTVSKRDPSFECLPSSPLSGEWVEPPPPCLPLCRGRWGGCAAIPPPGPSTQPNTHPSHGTPERGKGPSSTHPLPRTRAWHRKPCGPFGAGLEPRTARTRTVSIAVRSRPDLNPALEHFLPPPPAPASIRTRVWGTRTHPSHHRMDPDAQSRNTGHAFPGTDPPAFLLRRPRNPDGMSDPKGKHRGRKDGSKPNEPNNRTRGPGDGRRNANRGGATTTP